MQTKKVPFTFNRGGYYYFTRRIPKDLKHHYKCKRIVQGLRTNSSSTAKTRAKITAAKLDEYWSHLRMTDNSIIGKHMLKLANENLLDGWELDFNVELPTNQISICEDYLAQETRELILQENNGKINT